MKIKKTAKPCTVSHFEDELLKGYIDIDSLLEDPIEVKLAIETLNKFKRLLEKKGLLDQC